MAAVVHRLNRLLPYALPVLLSALYATLLFQGINLVTADLGRHLINGERFLQDWRVLDANTYSYTHPAFPAPNHHWLFGVLAYLIFSVWGFTGVHLAFIAVSVATFLIFFSIAQRKAGILLASAAALILLPIIAERAEVRPEALSYLFAGIFFLLLLKERAGTLTIRKLAVALGFIQIIWVNSHSYFFLGWALVSVFLFDSALMNGLRARRTTALALCLVLVLAVSLVNPFLLEGTLVPLTIFSDYGYRLVENQNVWFLHRVLNRPILFYVELILSALVGSFIYAFLRDRRSVRPAEVLLGVGCGASALLALRNFTLFGFFALPLLAENAAHLLPRVALAAPFLKRALAAVLVLMLLMYASGEMHKVYAYQPRALGLLKEAEGAGRFFREQKLRGPIFNNYDIGGYLIYHLYPQEKVFVDNRPEAYPAAFFTQTYIPMQEDEALWKRESERWGFTVIFFSYRDYTPWAQQFLLTRLADPLWAPVYADEFAIIFLLRSEKNAALIEQFKIPPERFTTIGA